MLATDDDQSGTATTSHNGWAHTATSATTSASSAQPPTADALANAADFLNRELALEGVQRPLVFIGASPDAAADVINTLYSLMQARKRDRAMRAEMMERMHRFESDYDNTMRNVARYKEVIAAKEREVRAGLSEYTYVLCALANLLNAADRSILTVSSSASTRTSSPRSSPPPMSSSSSRPR
ncbi:hypothetical protein BC828DRAFT_383612 [Blastocladiella britannica]|nr:hypothetical protein BC828DRAFT_383612 [Blastocladiella britannica]